MVVINVQNTAVKDSETQCHMYDLLGQSGPNPFPSLTKLGLSGTNLNGRDKAILRRLPNWRMTPALEKL